ncbi:acyl carrier protein [Streptomyces sp. NPDC017546]|uniref:acyl carrier protein n=1 Tax=unclassified Streptomyces TaxID=2593676 RepID=UPI0023614473|nr:acyl carrier protein [Streptomyces sp. MMBL 11-1]
MHAIEERVKKVIAAQLDVEEEAVTSSKHLVNDFGADALAMNEVITGLETEFQMVLSDEEVEKITTVQGAIDCVRLVVTGE